MSKIRTRTHSVFNKETFTEEFIVDVNTGSGWAWLVKDREILRFSTKVDAKEVRKDLVKRYKEGLYGW